MKTIIMSKRLLVTIMVISVFSCDPMKQFSFNKDKEALILYCKENELEVVLVQTFEKYRIGLSTKQHQLKVDKVIINNQYVEIEILGLESYTIIELIRHRIRSGDVINFSFQFNDCIYNEVFIVD